MLQQGIPAQKLPLLILEHRKTRSKAGAKPCLCTGDHQRLRLPVLRIPTKSNRLSSSEWRKENVLKTKLLSVADSGWEKLPWAWIISGRGVR